jgi:outer membrane protein assembly complex protein YaeT
MGNLGGLIAVKEGEPFSLSRVSNAIKQIYRTGLFSDVRVLKAGEGRAELTFLLKRKLSARKIVFRGPSGVSRGRLHEGLYSLRPGGEYTEDRLAKAKAELRDVLLREGYFSPEITSSISRDPVLPSLDVFFEINAGQRYTVGDIHFQGEILFPKQDLAPKMKSRLGKEYIPSRFDQDLARLKEVYKSSGYPWAEVKLASRDFDESRHQVSLAVNIVPHEKIDFIIKGAEVPPAILWPIWEERIFEEWGQAEGEARILSYLIKQGYIFATLRSSLERSENSIRVIYDVSPGQKHKIHDIVFEGLTYFTPDQLKKELDLAAKIPLFTWVDGQKVFELKKTIESLYEAQGFINTRVDLNFRVRGNSAEAIFFIDEGIQQKIADVAFPGAVLFSAEHLSSGLLCRKDGPFFQANVRKDIEKLESYYLNQGVRGTKISAAVEKSGEHLFSVKFIISEVELVRIEKIVVTGNVLTKKKTIAKELRIKEDEFAFWDAIQESKRNLENLGVFSEVTIEEIPLSNEKENVVISLKEGERNYVGVGIGLETKREPWATSLWTNELRPRGTAEFIRSNVLGRAYQFSLVAQLGLREKRGVVSWEQPYFFGLPVETYLNAWLEKEERVSFGFERSGISLTGIKPLSSNLMSLTNIRWARTILYFLEIEESEVDRQHYPFSSTSVSESIFWDKRDDTFNPERGFFLSGVLEWAYPLFKAESDYLKFFSKYQHFFPILSRVNFHSTLRLGLGMGRMPIQERFFAGGSNSFRGVAFDELGPEDPSSGKPVGGKALLVLNLELRFPVISGFQDLFGAIFYDKGNVYSKRKQVSLASLQDAVGFGLRYRTPLGPLRFDLGWNLDAPAGKKKPLAFITIGNVF